MCRCPRARRHVAQRAISFNIPAMVVKSSLAFVVAFALLNIQNERVASAQESRPTPDATVTTLQKEKLEREITNLERASERGFLSWMWNNGGGLLSAGTALLLLGWGVVQWKGNRSDEQDKRSQDQRERLADILRGERERLEDRRQEREKRTDELFQKVLEGLGGGQPQMQVQSAVMLRSFLREGYERLYTQVFHLAVGYLRMRSTSDNPDKREPLTPLDQALITVLRESYPRSRDLSVEMEVRRQLIEGGSEDDAIEFQVETYTLRPTPEGPYRGNPIQIDATRINLHNADLGDADLAHINMADARLNFSKLRKLDDSDLKGANLHRADLQAASLHRAILVGTDLTFANMSHAELVGADFEEAILDNAVLFHADLSEANPGEAKSMTGTWMHGVKNLEEAQRELCEKKGARFDDPHGSGKGSQVAQKAALPHDQMADHGGEGATKHDSRDDDRVSEPGAPRQ